MPSEVDICNLALQRLGAKTITALTDDSVNARECNRVYAHARDSELRAHPWSFARKRAQLAASSTAPAFEYARAFDLPSDFLRLLPNNGRLGQVVQDDLQIESGQILTNDGAPLNIIYIARITDPNTFDQGFIDLLVARVAFDLCEKITQSTNKFEVMNLQYQEAKATARRVNAFERPAQEAPADPWITARY
jgi:hypothetical protein